MNPSTTPQAPKPHNMARFKECKSAFEFGVELDRAAKVLGVETARQAAVILALQLINLITQRTPVDTGRARANWFLSEGAPRIATQLGTAAQTYSPADLTGRQVIFITNSLPYIVPLEYGHSGQAPNGMVRISIAEVVASINLGRAGA